MKSRFEVALSIAHPYALQARGGFLPEIPQSSSPVSALQHTVSRELSSPLIAIPNNPLFGGDLFQGSAYWLMGSCSWVFFFGSC